MKTVTGKIVSSSPASVSKAASILSKFVSTENGASQAVNAYLRRATAAFDELVRVHSKYERTKKKKEASQEPGHDEIGSSKKNKKKARMGDFVNHGDDKDMIVNEVEEKKKKNKDKESEVYVIEEKSDANGSNLVEETDKKKHKKKKKKRESGDAEENGVEIGFGEGSGQVGFKKEGKGQFGIENGGEVGTREGKEERKKKRKNREVEVVESGDGSEEPWSKKKKRRRGSEGEN